MGDHGGYGKTSEEENAGTREFFLALSRFESKRRMSNAQRPILKFRS
jgi:hypothetical protein